MKTAELIGPALDWAVAKAEGLDAGLTLEYRLDKKGLVPVEPHFIISKPHGWSCRYSTDWALSGPIIERDKIDLASPNPIDPLWHAMQWRFSHGMKGPTPLIAAMRCYVASKLSDEVNVPEELR